MTRRSTPAAKTDEAAFPVCMKLWVPHTGFGSRGIAMRIRLDGRIGTMDYAWHPGGVVGVRHTVSLYFRTPGDADEFLSAFPDLELADGTSLTGHSSLALPVGRLSPEDEPVCNLYNHPRTQDAIRQLLRAFTVTDAAGNLGPGSIYPDQLAPSSGTARRAWNSLGRGGACRRHPPSSGPPATPA